MTKTIKNPVLMKDSVATKDLGERRDKPQTP
jgi:hypothetical protein